MEGSAGQVQHRIRRRHLRAARDEQIAMYEAASGRNADGIGFHEVFAGARYTAIVVRVMNRLVDRGDLDPNHQIWLENPATVALAEIMKEQVHK